MANRTDDERWAWVRDNTGMRDIFKISALPMLNGSLVFELTVLATGLSYRSSDFIEATNAAIDAAMSNYENA